MSVRFNPEMCIIYKYFSVLNNTVVSLLLLVPLAESHLKYSDNPFLKKYSSGEKLAQIIVRGKDVKVLDKDDAEIHGAVMLSQVKKYDNRMFVKAYRGVTEASVGMDASGYLVRDWIMANLQYGKTSVFISATEVAAWGKITRDSIYRGIAQNLDRWIIAKSPSSGMYWVNTDFFMNGMIIKPTRNE